MEARPDTLTGLPIGIKDVVATEGFPTQCGTRLPPSVISQLLGTAEAECAETLRRAGAIIAGKTVTAELATYQPGPTVNPLSVDRTPGGSSSGSAAAVAAGDVRLALATQTAGSTIRPASYCGVLGFKPTYGRYAVRGVLPTSPTLDTLGLIADDLGLIDATDSALATSDELSHSGGPMLPRRLVLYRTSNWTVLPEEHRRQIEALARRLAGGFAEYREQEPMPEMEALTGHQRIVHAGELSSTLGWLVAQHGEQLSDAFKGFVEEGRGYANSSLGNALRAIQTARENALDLMQSDEVWLTPAVASVAPMLEVGTGDPLFCRQWTALGAPCLTLPLLREAATGLPYGPQFVMSPGADRQLLKVGLIVNERMVEGENR